MRILFIASGSAATVFIFSPLATAARNAGHEVLMTSTEDMTKVIASIGIPAVSVTPLPLEHFIYHDRAGAKLDFPTDPDEEILFTGRMFGRIAAACLDSLLELVDRWRPDLIVGGAMSYAAPILASHLGLPFVRHPWGASELTGMDVGANAELQPELQRMGLDRLPEPDLRIDICPPSLRSDDSPTGLPMRWRPANSQRPLQPWMYTRGTRRRVCVTAGSRANHEYIGFLCELAANVAALDVEILIAAPDQVAAAVTVELGGNVRAGWIPLDVVAPTCDLLVHHAGGVTSLTALDAGVPQLLIPEAANLVAPARRIADFGAGIMLRSGADTPEQVGSACQELLSDSGFKQRSQLIAREMAAMTPPADIVTTLATLAGCAGPG